MSETTRHVLADRVHYTWQRAHPPVARVLEGQALKIDCRDGFDGQLVGVSAADLDADAMRALDFRRVTPLTGPIYVEGAQPGDTLVVTIQALRPRSPGWCVVWPAYTRWDFLRTAMRDRFPEAALKVFEWQNDRVPQMLPFGHGVDLPVRPMLGMIGTAPAAGEFPTLPPQDFGGNIDCTLVAPGNCMLLPVAVPGALLSLGDGHACMGDGEACTTGVECAMQAEVRLDVTRGTQRRRPAIATRELYVTIGHGHTVEDAIQQAIEEMLSYLTSKAGLTAHEAYMLIGLAGNVGINELVDFPQMGARLELPWSTIPRHARELDLEDTDGVT